MNETCPARPGQMFQIKVGLFEEAPRWGRAHTLRDGRRVRCVAPLGWMGWGNALAAYALVALDTPLAWWLVLRYAIYRAWWGALCSLARTLGALGLAHASPYTLHIRGIAGPFLAWLRPQPQRWFLARLERPGKTRADEKPTKTRSET